MLIAMASDHNGVQLRHRLVGYVQQKGHLVEDLGTHDPDTPVDYPILVAAVAHMVVEGRADRGIIVGGTGSGEHIAANKVRGIRAAYCQDLLTARISRENNDTNVLVMGAMLIGWRVAEEIADIWLHTDFTHGRHVRRLEQIAAIERGERLSSSGN